MKKTGLDKVKGKQLTGGGFVPGGGGRGAAGAENKREQREREKQRLLQKRTQSK